MKKEWTPWMQSAGSDLTRTGRIKEASIAQVCDWILRSFKQCGISNAMDGTKHNEIFQDEGSDSSEFTRNVETEEDDTPDIE